MISCVICSNNTFYLDQVKENIAATIGVEYELIVFKNAGDFGICKAYNDGASRSKFPYVCFMHEDIKFLTPEWGLKAIAHFTSVADPGVLGLAGSIYKSRMISGWWQPPVDNIEPKRVNVIQHFRYAEKEQEHFYINPNNEERSLVAALDGVWLFTLKDVWSKNKFDENVLKGFHAYDLDFTLQVGTKRNNYVVYDIPIEHFSDGVNDINWFKSNILIHNKWRKILPVIKQSSIKEKDLQPVDQLWLHQLLSFPVASFFERLKLIYSCIALLRFNMLRLSVLLSVYNYVFKKVADNV